jgi:hypothetical protein
MSSFLDGECDVAVDPHNLASMQRAMRAATHASHQHAYGTRRCAHVEAMQPCAAFAQSCETSMRVTLHMQRTKPCQAPRQSALRRRLCAPNANRMRSPWTHLAAASGGQCVLQCGACDCADGGCICAFAEPFALLRVLSLAAPEHGFRCSL